MPLTRQQKEIIINYMLPLDGGFSKGLLEDTELGDVYDAEEITKGEIREFISKLNDIAMERLETLSDKIWCGSDKNESLPDKLYEIWYIVPKIQNVPEYEYPLHKLLDTMFSCFDRSDIVSTDYQKIKKNLDYCNETNPYDGFFEIRTRTRENDF